MEHVETEYEFFGVKLIVSTDGTIRTQDREYTATNQFSSYTRKLKGRVLTPACNGKAGYYQVKVNNNGKSKAEYVHRLVWKAFNGEIPEGYEIDHDDNVKSHNWLSNLNLKTRKENMDKLFERLQRDSLGRFLSIS